MAFADLSPDGSKIHITTSWNEKELLQAIPGARYSSKEKVWTLPLAWASCVTLRGMLQAALTVGPQLEQWAWRERQQRIDPCLQLRTATEFPPDWHEKHLFPFQCAGVEFMAYAGDALLGDEPGSGKTIQALSLLASRIGPAETLPALIICPNSVKHHWTKHVRKWLPVATPYPLDGNITEKRKLLAEAKENPAAVVIMNIESARLLSRLAPYGSTKLKRCRECDPNFGDDIKKTACEVHPKELNELSFQTVILDEAHRMKDPKSKQTRAIWHLMHSKTVKRRWALTGTPIAQHPGDLWSIMHGIAPYDFPVRSKFIDRYCLASYSPFGNLEIVGTRPDTRDELFSFLDPHFRRMTKAQVLPQLPPKVYETRYVEMTPQQRKMYREMSKKLETTNEHGEMLLAQNDMIAATRLLQLASASVSIDNSPDPDDPTKWIVSLRNPSPKLDEFEAILSDIGDVPCVAAAESKMLINLAAERLYKLEIPYALITGDVSEYDRNRAMEYLWANRIKVLLFTVKAGGVGLDMSCVDTLINIQRSWSLVDNIQTEDRPHRIGAERHDRIRIIDIVTRDTIEEDQIERLAEKRNRLEEITRDRLNLLAMHHDTHALDAEEAALLGSVLL